MATHIGHARGTRTTRGAGSVLVIAAVLTVPALYGFITGPAADGIRARGPAPAVSGATSAPREDAQLVLAAGRGISKAGGAIAVNGDEGLRAIDFGKVTAGAHLRYTDALRVKNLSDKAVPVYVWVSPGLAPALSVPKSARKQWLRSGEELRLTLDVLPDREAAPGKYDGEITIDQGDEGNLFTIPIQVQVVPAARDALPDQ